MRFQFNKLEKVMIVIYLVIVVLMLLNPPWAYFHPETGKFISSLGEHNVFDSRPEAEAQIHFSMLLYQIFVIGVLLTFIAFIFRSFKKLWKRKGNTSE